MPKTFPIALSKPDEIRSKGLTYTMGAAALNDLSPDVLCEAGKIVAASGYALTEMKVIASIVVGGRFAPISALLDEIEPSRHKLMKAIVKAAETVGMKKEDLDLTKDVLAEAIRIGARRNIYAHHLYTWSYDYPGALLIADPADYLQYHASVSDYIAEPRKSKFRLARSYVSEIHAARPSD